MRSSASSQISNLQFQMRSPERARCATRVTDISQLEIVPAIWLLHLGEVD